MTDIPPLHPQPGVMEFLATRRARPAKTLKAPAPDRTTLRQLMTAALRCPDHGKLEPWRLIVHERSALDRLVPLARERAEAVAPDKADKLVAMFADAPVIVTVVTAPKPSEKIPAIEQVLSAGALCHNICLAAHAAGWGANWLSGALAYDRDFLRDGLGLAETEGIAGFMVLGTEGAVPPERPRPDPGTTIEWVEA